jgi:Protein of unknown function (DUF3795)
MSGRDRVELFAPCGMDCAVCSAYLAWSHGIPRKRGAITHCAGCRARNKQCAWLKGICAQLRNNRIRYCYQCADFPCAHLRHLDARYRRDYGMSLIENLELIRDAGEQALIDRQQARFGCEHCGQPRSVHNRKCFACDTVRSWKA